MRSKAALSFFCFSLLFFAGEISTKIGTQDPGSAIARLLGTSIASAQNLEGRAAACLIRANNKMVVVRDAWSKRYSLPGGISYPDEKLEHTAKREVQEETGWEVEVGPLIGYLKKLAVFQCTPKDQVRLFGPPHLPRVWKVRDREVDSVYLVEPHELPLDEWRFLKNLDKLLQYYDSQPNLADVIQTPDRLDEADPIRKAELSWMERYQKTFGASWDSIFVAFNEMGEMTFFFVMFALAWAFLPPAMAKTFTFTIVATVLLNGFLKDLFALERPFDFVPSMQRQDAMGFGFPSGHTQTAATFWFFCAFAIGRFYLFALLVALMVGLARIYYGVHFPTDVLFGTVVGFFVAWLGWRWRQSPAGGLPQWIQTPWAVAILVLPALRFEPLTLALSFFILGFFLAEKAELRWSQGYFADRKKRWLHFVLILGGVFAFEAFFKAIAPREMNAIPIILIQMARGLVQGLWYGYLARRILSRF